VCARAHPPRPSQLSRYAGRQTAATAWFAAFALSWIILRVIIYPRTVVFNCLYDPIVLVALPCNIDTQVRAGGVCALCRPPPGGFASVGARTGHFWVLPLQIPFARSFLAITGSCCHSCGCRGPRPGAPHPPSSFSQPFYAIFGTLFLVLYFLHLYWTWLILQVRTRAPVLAACGQARHQVPDPAAR
jgi:hypothetical protein